jgi:hypothetical protein
MEKLSGIIAELELRNAFIFRSIYKLENSWTPWILKWKEK